MKLNPPEETDMIVKEWGFLSVPSKSVLGVRVKSGPPEDNSSIADRISLTKCRWGERLIKLKDCKDFVLKLFKVRGWCKNIFTTELYVRRKFYCSVSVSQCDELLSYYTKLIKLSLFIGLA